MIRKRNVTLGWNLPVYPVRHAGLGQVLRRAAAVTRNVNFSACFAREKRSICSRVTLAALVFYEEPRTVTLYYYYGRPEHFRMYSPPHQRPYDDCSCTAYQHK